MWDDDFLLIFCYAHRALAETNRKAKCSTKFRRDPQWDKTELREKIVSLESRDSGSFGIIVLGWEIGTRI